MQFTDHRNIRIHQIEIFLAAAETCNYSSAAEQLNVTQSMVTKTIQALEKELGLMLFRKSHGKLYQTPAGKELKMQWTAMMTLFESSIADAHAVQEAKSIPVHLGIGVLEQRSDLEPMMEALRPEIESGNVILERGCLANHLQRVRTGDLDLALCSGHLIPKVRNLQLGCRRIIESPLAVYVPEENPLSKRESISFSDLKNEYFITFSPDADPLYWNLLNQLAEEAGFRPRIGCYVKDEFSFEINLKNGRGIIMADSETIKSPGIRKFILEGTHCDLYLVWREDNPNPHLDKILKLI